ncbi:hypothetical protein [Actinophytocola sp.]
MRSNASLSRIADDVAGVSDRSPSSRSPSWYVLVKAAAAKL